MKKVISLILCVLLLISLLGLMGCSNEVPDNEVPDIDVLEDVDLSDEPTAAELDLISMGGFISALVAHMREKGSSEYNAASSTQTDVEKYLSYYAAFSDYGYDTLSASEIGVSGELAKEYVNFSQDEVAQFVDIAFGSNFSVADFNDSSELLIYNAQSYWIGKAEGEAYTVEYTGASGDLDAADTEFYYSFSSASDSGTVSVRFSDSGDNMYFMTIDSIVMN